ncbi:histidine phosphatase family protein [Oceanispirochaeta sp.]|jgi:phosphohistidine phosphatase|uniref:SixA phosphatase family protein n=1 Tax=Oceanispirochaeta sp. TaxID=2035350 RepID=UPI002614E406|nr:histidine phosphatase family protein [Oceanispirochaeta sp.]MDA3958506.1 histidine phosphatase family protein [Oceanispirochaeta sp.]
MKLVLIRHGKSDWHTDDIDFNRPLNKRGLKDAPLMAEELKRRGIEPDMILTSTAVRALTTARLMVEVFDQTVVEELPDLYLASAQVILETILTKMDDEMTLFLVGHNPGISLAAEKLIKTYIEMPTSAVVIIDLKDSGCKWELVSSLLLKPKDLN